VIVALCIGGPIVEMFDQWDQTLQDGNDTETNVAIVAFCVGVALAIGTVVIVSRIRTIASCSRLYAVAPRSISLAITSLAAPIPTSSPPTLLRV
jgi:hypothetical protein